MKINKKSKKVQTKFYNNNKNNKCKNSMKGGASSNANVSSASASAITKEKLSQDIDIETIQLLKEQQNLFFKKLLDEYTLLPMEKSIYTLPETFDLSLEDVLSNYIFNNKFKVIFKILQEKIVENELSKNSSDKQKNIRQKKKFTSEIYETLKTKIKTFTDLILYIYENNIQDLIINKEDKNKLYLIEKILTSLNKADSRTTSRALEASGSSEASEASEASRASRASEASRASAEHKELFKKAEQQIVTENQVQTNITKKFEKKLPEEIIIKYTCNNLNHVEEGITSEFDAFVFYKMIDKTSRTEILYLLSVLEFKNKSNIIKDYPKKISGIENIKDIKKKINITCSSDKGTEKYIVIKDSDKPEYFFPIPIYYFVTELKNKFSNSYIINYLKKNKTLEEINKCRVTKHGFKFNLSDIDKDEIIKNINIIEKIGEPSPKYPLSIFDISYLLSK